MLKLFGYAVEAVADGHAGVALYRENPGRFDLVLLDLVLPGLSGDQTLATLRILNPDVRVLLMSGSGDAATQGRRRDDPNLGFLSKPFTRETLEQGIRRLIG
jgi:two-component system C4-dicarboxylate transport response regulator DctD